MQIASSGCSNTRINHLTTHALFWIQMGRVATIEDSFVHLLLRQVCSSFAWARCSMFYAIEVGCNCILSCALLDRLSSFLEADARDVFWIIIERYLWYFECGSIFEWIEKTGIMKDFLMEHFEIGGYMNEQHCCMWDEENPRIILEKPAYPKRVRMSLKI